LEGHLGIRNRVIFLVRKFVPLMSEQSVAFRIWGFFVTQDVRQRIGAWCYRTQCLETCVCATRRVSDETMVIFCSCRPGQKMGINNASRSGKGLFVAWFGKVSGGSGFTSLKRLTSKPQAPLSLLSIHILAMETVISDNQFSMALRRA